MKIGCLQFSPQVGEVDNNLDRANAILGRANPMELENLDLLVLPEMAFTGYNFRDLEHIRPYLEHCGYGVSSLWAQSTALKYDCTVAVGYPERMDVFKDWIVTTERYNSLFVVNGDGETVANYRKTHLYYTDDTWAKEGCGFYHGNIDGLGQTAMGICMDINPYKFEAPWLSYEFAFHILEIKANLVIISMAWLTFEDQREFSCLLEEPDMKTLTYWIQRLEPLIRSDNEDEIIVVFANRCGTEDEIQYTGTSAVVGVAHGEIRVYGLLGRGVEGLLVVDTDMPPFAKLVSQSEPIADSEEEDELVPATAAELAGEESPILPQQFVDGASWTRTAVPATVCKESPEAPRQQATQIARGQRPQRPSISIPVHSPSRDYNQHPGTGPVSAGPTPTVPTPEAPTPTPPALRPRLSLSTTSDAVQRIAPTSSRLPSWTGHIIVTPPTSPGGRLLPSDNKQNWPPATAIADTPQESMWGSSGPNSAIDRASSRGVSAMRGSRHSSASRDAGALRNRALSKASSAGSSRAVSVGKLPARRPSFSTRKSEFDAVPASDSADFRGRDARPPWEASPVERPASPKRHMEQYQSPQEPAKTPASASSERNRLQTSITIAASPSIFEKCLPTDDRQEPPTKRREARNARQSAETATGMLEPRPTRRSASVSVPVNRKSSMPHRRSVSKGPAPMSRQTSRGPTQTSSSAFSVFSNLLMTEAEALADVAIGAVTSHSSLGKRCHSSSPGQRRNPGGVSLLDLRSPLTV